MGVSGMTLIQANTGFKTHPYFENRTFSVENYPNGWKRMSISFSSSNISGVFNLNVAPSNDEPYAHIQS